MRKSLRILLRDLERYEIFGQRDVFVTGIYADSRKVAKGGLFIAIPGLNFDGHNFIAYVTEKGVSAVVGEKAPEKLKLNGTTYIKVPNVRGALGLLASSWYDNPSRRLKTIGITGTDGKTTTANLVYSILKAAGKEVGLVSTINAKIGNKNYDTGFHVTTPEPLALQRFFALMLKKGCKYAVLEVTSHGLDQDRVAGILFEASLITNVTHEHLDYHRSFSRYLRTKTKIFARSKKVFLNKNHSSYGELKKFAPQDHQTFNVNDGLLTARAIQAISEYFPGGYNLQNAAAAAAVCRSLGISKSGIEKGFLIMQPLPGRMERVKRKPFAAIVDFAHTPNALQNVLQLIKQQTFGRVIAVFGCAGERDVAKRPMMGKIAGRLADVSIFTAEDPRGEDVNRIIEQMVVGARKAEAEELSLGREKSIPLHSNVLLHGSFFARIPERGEAIAFAIQKLAKKGDTVVVCGKGHERSMAYKGVEYSWSDQEAVRLALKGGVMRIKRN